MSFMKEMDDATRDRRRVFVQQYMATRWIPFRGPYAGESKDHYTNARQEADAIQDSILRGCGVDVWNAAERARLRSAFRSKVKTSKRSRARL